MSGGIADGANGEAAAFEVESSSCAFVAFSASLWCKFTLLEKEVVSPAQGLKITLMSVKIWIFGQL